VPGAWPEFAFSQTHMDAVHEAVVPKFKPFWESRHWKGSECISDLSLNIGPDASPGLALLRFYRNEEEAAAGAEKMLAALKTDATKAAEKAASKWTRRVRNGVPELGTKQAVIFATVALVTLGGVLAVRQWLRHRAEAHEGQGR
jgi:hypothetical protein